MYFKVNSIIMQGHLGDNIKMVLNAMMKLCSYTTMLFLTRGGGSSIVSYTSALCCILGALTCTIS